MPDEHQHRRRWIKLWTQETVHGTTMKELTPEERGIWFPLMCLAGDSPVLGKVCLAKNVGYTDEQLAGILYCSVELLKSTKETLQKVNKIKLNGNNVIEIVNYVKYQGTFDPTSYMAGYMKDYRKGIRKSDVKANGNKINTVKEDTVMAIDKTRQDNIIKDKPTVNSSSTIKNSNTINGDKSPFDNTYKTFQNRLKTENNKVGVLVDAFKVWHSDAPEEEFTDLGSKIAGLVKNCNKDYGLVLLKMFHSQTMNISGHHTTYIMGIIKGEIKKTKEQEKIKKVTSPLYRKPSDIKDN